MNETIIINIAENGDVQVEGKGIKGPDCVKLTAEIEKALGEVTKRTKTAEYHEQPKILRKVGA